MISRRTALSLGLLMLASAVSGAEPTFGPREPVNIVKAAGEAAVLLVGDDHTKPAIKNFLARSLADLKVQGFTVLAMEMVAVDMQNNLDIWTPAAQGRIRRHLEAAWGEKGPDVADSLFQLIDQAKRDGFRVIGLEPTNAHRYSRVDINPLWADHVRREREDHPASRVIVFAGRSHVDPEPKSLFSVLAASGIKSSVIRFAGLDRRENIDMDLKTARLLGRPARPTTLFSALQFRDGPRNKCMAACLMESQRKNSANWVISLAQEDPPRLAQR